MSTLFFIAITRSNLLQVNEITGYSFETQLEEFTDGSKQLFNVKTHVTQKEPVTPREPKRGNIGKNPLKSDYVTAWNRILSMTSTGYHGFNATASDVIGNYREIPDFRHDTCKNFGHLSNTLAPIDVSIVIVFHNEARSTLLRTIQSIFNRTLRHHLMEVILVDDASSHEWLGSPLTDYVTGFSRKIRILRLKERQGLIRARLEGARDATGSVLVFFDAHIEVGYDWLPPLLQEQIGRASCRERV